MLTKLNTVIVSIPHENAYMYCRIWLYISSPLNHFHKWARTLCLMYKMKYIIKSKSDVWHQFNLFTCDTQDFDWVTYTLCHMLIKCHGYDIGTFMMKRGWTCFHELIIKIRKGTISASLMLGATLLCKPLTNKSVPCSMKARFWQGFLCEKV